MSHVKQATAVLDHAQRLLPEAERVFEGVSNLHNNLELDFVNAGSKSLAFMLLTV